MVIIDLIYNLSVLASLSVFAGFINSRYQRTTLPGKILQGLLFGLVAVIGMLYPFNFETGIIIDGRSIVISLCTLFFGSLAGLIASVISIIFRFYLGGGGAVTGSLVIAASFLLGSLFYFLWTNEKVRLTTVVLYLFGLSVSAAMMALMLTLPSPSIKEAYKTITFTVMIFYPLITLLIGKVIQNHEENKNYLDKINEEKSQYLTTLYSIGDAVIVTDKLGKVMHFNPVAEKLTGWTEKEAIGKSLKKVFHIINEYSRQEVESPLDRVLKEGIVVGLANHTLLVSKNGVETPITDSGAPIKDKKGIIRGVVLVFRDQSEDREKQKSLSESEERFRSIVEGAPDPIFIQTDKKFAYLNPAALKLFGAKDIYDLVGKPVMDRFHPYFHNVVRERIRLLNEERKPVNKLLDLIFIRLDGSEVWVETAGVPMVYEGKNGALVFVRDITERKLAEQELLKREAEKNTILQTAMDGFWIVDNNGKIIDTNVAACLMTGYSKDEMLTMAISDVEANESETETVNHIDRVLTNGSDRFETKHRCKNGNIIDVEISTVGDAMAKRIFVFVRDITERKKLEQERFQLFNIVNSSLNEVYLFDSITLKFQYANYGALNNLGYTWDEFKEMTPVDIKPEFNFESFQKIIAPLLAHQKERITFETIHRRKNGTDYNVSIYLQLHNGEEKEQFFAIVNDITEKKKAENKLRQSEERFNELAKQSRTIIWEVNADGLFTYASSVAETVWGYKPEELVGKYHFYDLHPQEGLEEFKEKAFSIFKRKEYFNNFENLVLTKDSKLVWVTTNGIPILDTGGKLIGYRGSDMDITERKIAEEKLIKSHELLKNLSDLVPGVVYQYRLFPDGRSCFPYSSIGMETIYEYTSDEVREDATPVFGRLHPEDYDNVAGLIMESAKTLELFHCVFRVILPKQGLRWRLSNAVPVRLEDGSTLWHGIILDITEQKKAEQAVRESEEKLRSIFLVAPTGIGVVINRVFQEVNPRFCEMTGFSKEELIGQSARMIYPTQEDYDFVGSAKYKMIADLGTGIVETKWKTKEDKIIYVLLASTPLDLEDLSKGVAFTALDITDRKEAEEKLLKSEQKFRNLFENHSAVKLIIDPNTGIIIDANEAASKYYGWTREELMKMRIHQINILSHEEVNLEIEKARKQKRINFEFKHKRADGSIRDVEVYSSRINIGDKEYLHSIVHDITQKKIAEAELQKRSEAIEQSQVSIVITNLEGNIEYVNPAFTQITGYTNDEVLGKNPRLLQSGDHDKFFYENLWNSIISGAKWAGIFRNKKKNGELFWESSIISPIKNEDGKITHFVAVKEDITEEVEKDNELKNYREHLEKLVEERTEELDQLNKDLLEQLQKGKELEEQLRVALSKEKELNDLKTRFIATVSHEFRTPLATLLSSAQMIQRYSKRWSEEKLNEHYDRISSTVNYLTQLLDDVLMISRADREILANKPAQVNLEELLQSYYEEIKPNLTSKHNLIISNVCSKKTFFVDKKLLRHIVINLLTNAIKYSPGGGKVEMIISCENEKLIIKISDEGLGIPEDELQYIFEPFYRTRNSMGIQGTGLGLNIAKRALEILGGNISVESKMNIGTTFNLRVPIYEE